MTTLLETKDLYKHFDSRRGLWGRMTGNPGFLVQAVSGINLRIEQGSTLGLIGESGCGKSSLGRTLLRLHEPTRGDIFFGGENICTLASAGMKALRSRMQIIFQDPYASLNPRKSVREIIAEPLAINTQMSAREIESEVRAIAEKTGLKPEFLDRYPHQFSGGQRQRIGIARALILKPQFVVCDEPVSALDVSVQAQIIELLNNLKAEFDLTYLFISHDISVIAYLSDRIAVMYLGEIVEEGARDQVLHHPAHPYTQSLMSAVPRLTPSAERRRHKLSGDLPSPINPPSGCKFHTRCPYAKEVCKTQAPAFVNHNNDGQKVACHFAREL